MSVFKRAAEKLRGRGVSPAALALGGATATYTTVNGYTWMHLAASCAAGVLFTLGASGLAIVETGHWIGSAPERAIVEGVEASGIDVKSLSAADLHARLSYSPEEGRALVDAIGNGKKPIVDALALWLRGMDGDRRQEALQNVLILSSAIGSGSGKFELAKALLDIDEATAASFHDSDDIAQLLSQLARIPAENRHALAVAKFPIRPVDTARAELWPVINSQNFPAVDLIAPIRELAQAHPTRLSEIRKYIKDGAPLQQCKTAYCTPVACVGTSRRGYQCSPGYYLTEGKPICAPGVN